ncbi:heat shock protein HtpX [Methanolinea mesophila]|uniref:zinc metalloprotease HtpX n=1 Tax=Methanolinea mesophila TaxID=547055 RepID=UPI001AE305D6|nr:zinc metalloprotease HtpX [Methanolinea mesophila]MBP1928618.1 heat shock protein HtpX [Methanolinea mesophila]
MKWKRDWGLTMRIWLTMFLLFLVYLVFIAVLAYLGLGLPFLIGIVFVLAFVQYFFSDKLVLWSTRARVVAPDEYPELHRMVERLAGEAGIPKPRVAVMQSPVPNAFATGRSPKHAVVAVTDSILRLLSPRELEAVLAHELSHVKNRDVLTLTLASFLAMLAALIMNNFIFAAMFSRERDSPWIIAGIVAIIVYFVSQLLILALSRYREFAADRGSAYITRSPRDLITALQKISNKMDYVPPQAKQQVETANAFFIIPALSGRTLMELFSTHPPLEKRIANLEKVELELRGY